MGTIFLWAIFLHQKAPPIQIPCMRQPSQLAKCVTQPCTCLTSAHTCSLEERRGFPRKTTWVRVKSKDELAGVEGQVSACAHPLLSTLQMPTHALGNPVFLKLQACSCRDIFGPISELVIKLSSTVGLINTKETRMIGTAYAIIIKLWNNFHDT